MYKSVMINNIIKMFAEFSNGATQKENISTRTMEKKKNIIKFEYIFRISFFPMAKFHIIFARVCGSRAKNRPHFQECLSVILHNFEPTLESICGPK